MAIAKSSAPHAPARLSLILLLLATALGVVAAPATGDQLTELERAAEARFEQGDTIGAIDLYRQLAERIEPAREKARVLVLAAWLAHGLGREAEVVNTLTDALGYDPDYPFRPELYDDAFYDLFLRGRERGLQLRQARVAEQIARGLELLGRRDLDGARDALRAALEVDPYDPTALYNLAVVELRAERNDDALDGFQRLLALADGGQIEDLAPSLRAQALTNLGYLYSLRGQDLEATEVLEQALAIDPRNGDAWTNLGVARRSGGQKSAAAEAFQRAYQLAPEQLQSLNNLALAYLDAGEWSSAVSLLTGAAQRHGNDARLWLNLALAHRGLGDVQQTANALETAMQRDPEDREGVASTAAVYLARLHYQNGDPARTLTQAARALAWRSSAVDAWIYQALAHQALGNLAQARDSLEEARRLEPTRAEIHNNLGSVYYQLGALDQAEEAIQQALAIRPDLPTAADNLAAVRAARAQGLGRRAPSPPAATRQEPSPPAPPTRSRPALGLRYADIDYSSLGITGAMIEAVEPGTPASRAALIRNDLILKVDGRPVSSGDELERYLYLEARHARVVLDVLRDSKPIKVELVLE